MAYMLTSTWIPIGVYIMYFNNPPPLFWYSFFRSFISFSLVFLSLFSFFPLNLNCFPQWSSPPHHNIVHNIYPWVPTYCISRVQEFDALLSSEGSVDIKALKQKCFRGIWFCFRWYHNVKKICILIFSAKLCVCCRFKACNTVL